MNSKKHWTSMFIKSELSTSSGNQLMQTSDSSATRLPHSELGESSNNYAMERETSQPKARSRWNPKPEQIRILEAIFQSGVVSPPREEIKRIRAQLEVFGEVGDANVYYWFQNRKSRSKRKPRLPAAQRSKSRTQSGTLSSTSSTSTSTSVHSKTVTEMCNSPANSMHSKIGDEYYSISAVPAFSFAQNHDDMQALYEEMSKTSTPGPSITLPSPSNCPDNAMQANIGDQYCFSSAAPLYSSAGNHDDLHTSTSAPSQTLLNSSNSPPNAMQGNIGDQYCFSSAVPLYSSVGRQYDLHPSTSVPFNTSPNFSNSPGNAMQADIGDEYCFSSAAPVHSSAEHHYDLHTVHDEMINYNELYNMQEIRAAAAAAAGGPTILNEGIGGVKEGSITNPGSSITVFINDVPTAIPSGPINVSDFFGNDSFLFHSSGESVLVNEFGLTSLDHGATYFLI